MPNSFTPARPSRLGQRFHPPKRSRAGSSGHFERPSEAGRTRAPNLNAPAKPNNLSAFFDRPSEAERARAAISGAPARPSGFERLFRASQRRRAGSSDQFRAPLRPREGLEQPFLAQLRLWGRLERARAAISRALAVPSWLERPFRSPSGCGAVTSGVFEAMQVRSPGLRASRSKRRTQIQIEIYSSIFRLLLKMDPRPA